MKKILHIITDLEQGGAEGVLFRLVTSDKSNVHIVVSLMSNGYYGDKLLSSNIQLYCILFTRGRINFSGLLKLNKIIRSEKPDIVQTWLYHADLIGGILAVLNKIKICWSLHLTNVSLNSTKFTTYLTIRILALFSYFIPDKIISCSYSAIKSHSDIGFNKNKFVYIPLGFNYSNFFYDGGVRKIFRQKLNLNEVNFVIGCVARWDLQKDHGNLFSALSILRKKKYFKNIKICLAGFEMDLDNKQLLMLISKNELDLNMFIMLGASNQINEVYNGIDLLVLPSKGESFPNVIVEGLLTNVPVISTDVGDVKILLNQFLTIVEPSNPLELSKAIDIFILSSLKSKQARLSQNEKLLNTVKGFSITNMVDNHNKLWKEL